MSAGPLEGLGAGSGTERRGLVLMLVVFALGIVCGAALAVIVIRSVLPPGPRARAWPGGGPPGPARFERMAERLDLTEEQRRLIRAELATTRQNMDRLVHDSAERIRAVLDEDQRRRFDEMRRLEGSRRRGPPPAP